MKSNAADSHCADRPVTAYPAITADDRRHYQETSHIFNCMQCHLQFQMDIAVLS
jgi:hypothetical protein